MNPTADTDRLPPLVVPSSTRVFVASNKQRYHLPAAADPTTPVCEEAGADFWEKTVAVIPGYAQCKKCRHAVVNEGATTTASWELPVDADADVDADATAGADTARGLEADE